MVRCINSREMPALCYPEEFFFLHTRSNCESEMAELGHGMDVDSPPVVPPHAFESLRSWDISKLRETITASLLDPIRRAVREEVKSAFTYEQRMVSQSVLGRSSITRSLSIAIR